MKKLLIFLSLVLLFCFAGCAKEPAINSPKTSPPAAAQKTEVKVIKAIGDSFLVADIEKEALSSALFFLPADKMPTSETVVPGDLLTLDHDGLILETYPATFGNLISIEKTGSGDDLVGLYEQAAAKLWEVDPGLNPSAGTLALDLSLAENLTETEKNALCYVLSQNYKLETVQGTFEELREKGYIKEKDGFPFFEAGMLMRFQTKEIKSDSFLFDAEKWCSGLGAYFFMDCKATKTTSGYTFTIGSEAIS